METVETYTPVINLRCFSNYPHAEMELDSSGEWVRYGDYKELSEYADKLAEGLPCLPKDIEVLRDANATLAQRVFELEQQLKERN
jgi:hypothetical protein